MPDVKRILEAVDKYDADLKKMGIAPKRASTGNKGTPSDTVALALVRWMCAQVREFAQEERFDKCNRWLGFIQGVLWREGYGSIDGFRVDNTR